jgi:hypothetical protein
MRATWKYIEEHHQQYGVGLFVVPVLLFAGALAGVGYLLAWMLR